MCSTCDIKNYKKSEDMPGRCTGRNNSMTMTCASANPHP